MKKKHNYDIVIVEEGLIGLFMAIMLIRKKIKILLIEKGALDPSKLKTSDKRTTALSQGTMRILKNLDLWKFIEPFAQSIKDIDVFDGFSRKRLKFESSSLKEGDLGYIVENKILKKILLKNITSSKMADIFPDTEVIQITQDKKILDEKIKIETAKKIITSNLVIGADGRNSRSRFLNNMKFYEYDYKQNAYIFNIKHKDCHNNKALEIFYPEGPLAVLPMLSDEKNHQSSVVWTIDKKLGDFTKLKKKDFKTEFLKRYKNYFGSILSISLPNKYPLNVKSSFDRSKNRFVLIGDASQAIHPIAGQGFNLGVRDCVELAKNICKSTELGIDPGMRISLAQFENKRLLDKELFVGSTHFLNILFSNNNSGIRYLRKTGIGIIERMPILKNQLMKIAMGLSIIGD